MIKKLLNSFFSNSIPLKDGVLYLWAYQLGIVDIRGFLELFDKLEGLKKIKVFVKDKPTEKVFSFIRESGFEDRIDIIVSKEPKRSAKLEFNKALFVERVVSRDMQRDPC